MHFQTFVIIVITMLPLLIVGQGAATPRNPVCHAMHTVRIQLCLYVCKFVRYVCVNSSKANISVIRMISKLGARIVCTK